MSNICVDCGLCCDGTMYSQVDLVEGDSIEFFQRAGLHVGDPTENVFRLPCPAFGEGCCSIHGKHPVVCRNYRCALRIRYDDGQVPLADARRIIASATAIRDNLRPALERVADVCGPHSFEQLYKVALPKLEAMQGGARPLAHQAELLLDIGALNILLTRHFRLPAKEPCETDGREATGDQIATAMGH